MIHHAHKNRLTADGKMSFAPRPAEPMADQVNAAIDRALEQESAHGVPRGYLGGSRIGLECARQLAYEYFRSVEDRNNWRRITENGKHPDRWRPQSTPFKGKTLRRFRLGHIHEEETARWLRLAGFQLTTHRPDGRQLGFAVAPDPETGEPRMSGSMDGRIESGPVALPYPLLWEHKIMKASKWNQTLDRGVATTYKVYYYQMQTYMAYMDLQNALFTALNTDTSELLFELVPFNLQEAQWASDRGVKILEAESPEDMPRVTSDPTDWRCRFCDYKDRCWSKTEPKVGAVERPVWLGAPV